MAAERWLAAAWRPDARRAAALSLGWAVMLSGVVVLTTWLLSPAVPPPFYYIVSTPLADEADGPMRIGGEGSLAGSFAGVVDDVRVYARARTADEIRGDMQRSASVPSPDPDLVAAYDFDTSDWLAAAPVSSAARDSARGVSWTESGRHGGGLRFDGRSTGLSVPGPDGLDVRGAMTLEAWVRPEPPGGDYLTIIQDAGGDYVLRASSGDGTLFPSLVGRFGEAPRLALSRRAIRHDDWTHVAATYDAQVLRLYVDGRLAASLRQWSPHRPVRTTLGGVDLPAGPVPVPADLRSQVLGDLDLDVTLECGVRQATPAPAFLLLGVQSIEVLAVDAAGAEVHVRASTWAERLGIRAPPSRATGVLEDCRPGKRVAFEVTGPLARPTVIREDGTRAPIWIPGVGAAWALALDSRILPVPLVLILSVGFVAALTMPFGYWARAALPTAAGASIAVACLGLAAAWSGMPVAGWPEGAGACLGTGLGALGARARQRRIRSRCERGPS
jgi:hypothetical protein